MAVPSIWRWRCGHATHATCLAQNPAAADGPCFVCRGLPYPDASTSLIIQVGEIIVAEQVEDLGIVQDHHEVSDGIEVRGQIAVEERHA